MANPKPVYTLTRWKVLSNEEASELIDTGRMQREIPNVPTEHFTNAELETLSKGQPLFCVWKGQYIMVAYRDGRFVGYEVEERRISVDELVAAAKDGTLEEVWGTGTAAVVSPVNKLRYEDDVMLIGDGGIGELTQKLYDELTGIQWGKLEDKRGWRVTV